MLTDIRKIISTTEENLTWLREAVHEPFMRRRYKNTHKHFVL